MTTAPPGDAFALDISVADGRMHRHRVAFPWSLGRPYACETWRGAFRLIPQVSGAGLLSGDHVRQRVRLGPQTRLRIESAGAMQVLSGQSGPARSDWSFALDPGAMLVLDAEPYALMPRAQLDLRSDIRLAPGAILLASETICHTHANIRKNQDGFGEWHAQTRLADMSGELMFTDRQAVSHQGGARLGRLPDGMTAFGTIWVLADPNIAEQAVANLPDVGCRIALSPLRAKAGFAIRLAATDGGTLRVASRALMAVLEMRLARAQACAQAKVLDQAARSCAEPAMVAQT